MSSESLGMNTACLQRNCKGSRHRTGRTRTGEALTGVGVTPVERVLLAEVKCDACGQTEWLTDGTVVDT